MPISQLMVHTIESPNIKEAVGGLSRKNLQFLLDESVGFLESSSQSYMDENAKLTRELQRNVRTVRDAVLVHLAINS